MNKSRIVKNCKEEMFTIKAFLSCGKNTRSIYFLLSNIDIDRRANRQWVIRLKKWKYTKICPHTLFNIMRINNLEHFEVCCRGGRYSNLFHWPINYQDTMLAM